MHGLSRYAIRTTLKCATGNNRLTKQFCGFWEADLCYQCVCDTLMLYCVYISQPVPGILPCSYYCALQGSPLIVSTLYHQWLRWWWGCYTALSVLQYLYFIIRIQKHKKNMLILLQWILKTSLVYFISERLNHARQRSDMSIVCTKASLIVGCFLSQQKEFFMFLAHAGYWHLSCLCTLLAFTFKKKHSEKPLRLWMFMLSIYVYILF